MLHVFPCAQICLWCFHRIRDDGDGMCPACRQPYGADGADDSEEDSDDSDEE